MNEMADTDLEGVESRGKPMGIAVELSSYADTDMPFARGL